MPDVTVLVGAYRTDAADHQLLRGWLEEALAQLAFLLDAPGVVRVRPGGEFLRHFTRLCRESTASGNRVSDAAHAAVAIEAGATWVTLDAHLRAFAGLRVRSPLPPSRRH